MCPIVDRHLDSQDRPESSIVKKGDDDYAGAPLGSRLARGTAAYARAAAAAATTAGGLLCLLRRYQQVVFGAAILVARLAARWVE